MRELITKILESGLVLDVVDGKLKLYSENSEVDAEILSQIRANKEELTAYLIQNKIEENKQSETTPIPKLKQQDTYAISDAQRRLWILSQFEEGSIAYNLLNVVHLEQSIDLNCFNQSILDAIERHEILRTVFKEDPDHVGEGEIRQCVLSIDALDFKVNYLDFREESDGENQVEKFLKEDAYKPFDLEKGPLLRAFLLQIEDEKYVFYYNMHHIISDAWSIEVLSNDVLTSYQAYTENKQPQLPELQIQYKDYSAWQIAQLNQESTQKHLTYWLKSLSGELPLLDLPSSKKRATIKTYNGNTLVTYLDQDTTQSLKRFAQKNGGSLFMGVLAVWNILFYRYTGLRDIIIGTPVAGREHPELQNQIGFYVNTLALRNQIDPTESFNTFFKRIKDNCLTAYEHQSYPFDRLVEDLNLKRDTSRSAVFDIMLSKNMHENGAEFQLPELYDEIHDQGPSTSKFDIDITFQELGESMSFELVYNIDVYEREMVEGLLRHFKQLVHGLLKKPEGEVSKVDFLSAEERNQITATFNKTEVSYPNDETILDLFEKKVDEGPDKLALLFGDTKLTYGELNDKANQLAYYLQYSLGIKPKDLIGLQQSRNEWMIISILGVLKLNAAYVSVDPSYPKERIDYILKDCALCLDEKEINNFKESLVDTQFPDQYQFPESENKGDSLAYVIYTSGSTGAPKGVMVMHKNVYSFIRWTHTEFKKSNFDIVLFSTSLNFDLSVFEIFHALTTGKELMILEDGLEIFNQADTERRLLINVVPSVIGALLDLDMNFDSIAALNMAGEPIPPSYIAKLKGKVNEIRNLYGPSEDTTYTTVFRIDKDERNLIGQPISNTEIYILNESDELQPIGVIGEIHIGGSGVARGYLNQPELTAEKFIPSPFITGDRLYKTGDLGRWLPDGNIEFMGRQDDQVKIRGYRIELGEIENALGQYKGISQTVVLAKENEEGGKELVAYLIAKQEQNTQDLRSYLRNRIPEYMLPSHFVQLENFPLTANGKIDKKALPNPEGLGLTSGIEYVAPNTKQEKCLVSVWSAVLKREQIGIKDSFYHLGGDSIKSIQVVARVKQQGYMLKVEHILRTPVLEELALLMQENLRIIDQSAVKGSVELTPIQHWFFEADEIKNRNYFNQSVLLSSHKPIDTNVLEQSVQDLTNHHDALRMFYEPADGSWNQINGDDKTTSYTLDFYDLSKSESPCDELTQIGEKLQAEIDISQGKLLKVIHFRLKEGDRLGLIIHHLVVDGVSWRILLEDLSLLYTRYQSGEKPKLPLKTDSFQSWAAQQKSVASTDQLNKQRTYWEALGNQKIVPLPQDKQEPQKQAKIDSSESFILNKQATELLQTKVHQTYNTEVNDVLLTSLGLAIKEVLGTDKAVLKMEGHGREDILDGVDISRTVGWFTTMYPFVLDVSKAKSQRESLINIKEDLRQVPHKGIGYGILKYLSPQGIANELQPEIVFNYLGDFGTNVSNDEQEGLFDYAFENLGPNSDPENGNNTKLDISGMLVRGELSMTIGYSQAIFNDTTIKALVHAYGKHLKSLIAELSSSNETHLTPSDLSFKGLAVDELAILNKDNNIEDVYELSPLQEGIYFHWLSDESSSLYFEQTSYRVHATNLVIEDIKQAYDQLIIRHGVLRTSFSNEYAGKSLQIVRKQVPSNFHYEKMQGETDKDQYVQNIKQKDRDQGFDLTSPSQMRLLIVDLAEGAYEFIWSHHHTLMDGWCMSVLINDFNELLSAQTLGIPVELPPVKPYVNYINWLNTIDKEDSLAYWKNYLADYSDVAHIPFKLKSATGAYNESHEYLQIEGDLFDQMDALCSQVEVTQNTFVQAVWAYLLSRYNNTTDVVFGAVVSGRPAELAGIEDMIGLFINTIPVRVQYESDQTPKDLLKAVQEKSIESTNHHYMNLSAVQSQSELGAGLINHILVFENYAEKELESEGVLNTEDEEGLRVESMEVFEQTNYDFNITVVPTGNRVSINFDYNNQVYDSSSLKKLVNHFKTLITKFVESSNDALYTLDYLSLDERHELLNTFSGSAVDVPTDKTTIDLFEEQVRRTPDKKALVYESTTLTYQELNDRSNQFARYLQKEYAVESDDLIGVKLERSEWLLISILGILKSGGAYVPIDPQFPKERITFIEKEIQSKVCIDLKEIESFMKSQKTYSKVPLDKQTQIHDLAYIIFTSGSTGTPKGVMVSHENLINKLYEERAILTTKSEVISYGLTNYAFDVSLLELFLPITAGGTVVIPADNAVNDAKKVINQLIHEKVNLLQGTPSYFSYFISEVTSEYAELLSQSLEMICIGGESLHNALVGKIKKCFPKVILNNHYGPTEITIDALVNTNIDSFEANIIGKPLGNTAVYILDNDQNLVPINVVGELVISGPSVTKGYLNQNGLTNEKFINDPFNDGVRAYRTGDLAKWLPSGEVEFIGRQDDQVKIKAYRMELGEIESHIKANTNISDAVVTTYGEHENKKLVAYIVPEKLEQQFFWPSVGEYPVYDEYLYQAMTNDENRTSKYIQAINNTVKGKTVVDIGTGQDFILSRYCVDAGAKKVYAIEMNPVSYAQAKQTIKKLGLSDKIELIHGNAMEVELPELVDVCVSEIIGTIGSSEGAPVILNNARRFLKESGVMIPERCITSIAAYSLSDDLYNKPGFNQLGSDYIDDIFNHIGKEFNLRICLNNVDASNIISTMSIAEDLDFTAKTPEKFEINTVLEVTKSGRFDGLLLWLNLYTKGTAYIDTLNKKTSWLPVYLPVFYPGLDVKSGDQINVQFEAKLSQNGINPDYRVEGKLIRKNESDQEFEFNSTYGLDLNGENSFYEKLFKLRRNGYVFEDQESRLLKNLNTYLMDFLPSYMIPNQYYVLDELPRNANGKIDKKALVIPEGKGLASGTAYVAPESVKEKLLASVWQDVLKKQQVGAKDSFYNLGGDSIKSIQVIARLKQHDYKLKIEDVLRTPVLEDLALLVKRVTQKSDQNEVVGAVELTPIQHWFFKSEEIKNHNHFNQSVLLVTEKRINPAVLEKSIHDLVTHHDALRMIYEFNEGQWLQTNKLSPKETYSIDFYDLSDSPKVSEQIFEMGDVLQASMNIEIGPLFRIVHLRLKDSDRLGLIIHHLIVDGVSWRILLEDFSVLYSSIQNGVKPKLPLKTDSFQKWARLQNAHAHKNKLQKERVYWEGISNQIITDLPIDKLESEDRISNDTKASFYLDKQTTDLLQTRVHDVYSTEVNDVLLTGLGLAIRDVFGQDKVALKMEGHGREEILPAVDITRTVGWFTTVYPFILDVSSTDGQIESLIAVKEALRRIPQKGIGYGMLKYLTTDGINGQVKPQVIFNYLGDFGSNASNEEDALFDFAAENLGSESAKENENHVLLDISGMLVRGELSMTIGYSQAIFNDTTIKALVHAYGKHLKSLIAELSSSNETHLTPSDLSFKGLAVDELAILNKDNNIEDVYELSPLQEGIYFHWLSDESSSLYFEQTSYRVHATNLVIEDIKQAYDQLIIRHGVLRTSFSNEYAGKSLQIVRKQVPSNFHYEKIQGETDKDQYVQNIKQKDRDQGFDLTSPSQMRLLIVDLAEGAYEFIWSHHHTLMDGWCMSVLINDFNELLSAQTLGIPVELPPVKPYVNYINWLNTIDKEDSLAYWKNYLADYSDVAHIPFKLKSTTGAYNESHEYLQIEGDLFDQMDALCSQVGVTQNTFVQAVWAYLLSRYNNTTDVVFGAVVSGRPAELAGIEDMIGLFINTIPVRVQYESDQTPKDLLKAVQEKSIESTNHHYMNLSAVQSQSELGAGLINHILVFENYAEKELESEGVLNTEDEEGLRVESMEVFEQTNYDFNLVVHPSEKALDINISYNNRVYDSEALIRLIGHFKNVIVNFLSGADLPLKDLNYLSSTERESLLGLQEQVGFPEDKTVIDLFTEQVEQTPNNIALVFNQVELSYSRLDELSNQFAHYLQEDYKIKPNDLIGIKQDRSEWMIISILAVLKSGGAYVPIDPENPQERIEFIEKDTKCKVCIDEHELNSFQNKQENYSTNKLVSKVQVNDLAYIIYTSGSTGKPKGVMVDHHNVVRLFKNDKTLFNFKSTDVWTLFHSYAFDFSVWEMYGALLFGGKVVLVSKQVAQDPNAYLTLLKNQGVTILNQTPSSFYNLSKAAQETKAELAIRYVIFGGEALSPGRLSYWHEQYPNCQLINMYGITEGTVHTTYKEITQAEITLNKSNIGTAIPTVNCLVLDENRKLVPYGVSGELYIGGDGIAQGYLNREALTKERFVPNPFSVKGKLYRTGDKVKQLITGDLEYLGRIDDQVKIRGHRIELGEIENALSKNKAIEETVVLAKENDSGEKELIAYLTSKTTQNASDLRIYLRESLPDYMLPAYYVQLDRFPLTTNGKVNKKALPNPEGLSLASGVQYVAPRNQLETQLVSIWEHVLLAENIGIKDDFFAIGGDSMKSIQIMAQIKKVIGKEIKVADLYKLQTIESIGNLLDKQIANKENQDLVQGKKKIEAFKERVSREVEQSKYANHFTDFYPISPIEQGMIFSSLMNPDEPVYYDQFIYNLVIEDPEKFKEAIAILVDRHDMLRTKYYMDSFDEPLKGVFRDVDIPLFFDDISGKSNAEQGDTIQKLTQNLLDKRLSFDNELLWTLHLNKISKHEYVVVFCFHHSLLDGWSTSIFRSELSQLLASDNKLKLAPLKCEYKDYTATVLGRQESLETKSYWKDMLDGYIRNKLPFNFKGTWIPEEKGMRDVRIAVDDKIVEKLAELSRSQSVSFKAISLAAHLYLLRIISTENDVVTGVVTHDRPPIEDAEKVMGCFLYTVPVRVNFEELDSLSALLHFTQNYLIEVKPHEVHLTDILKFIDEKAINGNPIFDTLLNFTDFHEEDNVESSSVAETGQLFDEKSTLSNEMTNTFFDLEADKTHDRFSVKIKYVPGFFHKREMEYALSMYVRILEQMVTNIDQPLIPASLLLSEDNVFILDEFNNTIKPYSEDKSLFELFEIQAAKTPEAIALRKDRVTLTYKELNEKANKIARHLVDLGVKPAENIGLVSDRSFDMMIYMYGILKAGGAYVPIDPEYPLDRQEYIITNSGVKRILTDSNYPIADILKEAQFIQVNLEELEAFSSENLGIRVDKNQLAYTIYTSGSTGRPKGVMIEHHSAVNLVEWVNDTFDITTSDRLLFITSMCFDLSVYDIFGTLSAGGSLVIVEKEQIQNLSELTSILKEEQITFWDSVPTTMNYLVGELEQLEENFKQLSLRIVFLSGDWIPVQLPDRIKNYFPNAQVISLGGATEGTVWSNYYPVLQVDERSNSIPYGKPIDNNFFYILDSELNMTPPGVAGELYIGGVGVARGYANDPEKTGAAFVQDPFNKTLGGRMYRTGDLGRMLPDGNMEFLGRADHQVKIRGYRVELGEIESVLSKHASIKEAAVDIVLDKQNNNQLVAYYAVLEEVSVAEIRNYLRDFLPTYMMPSFFIMMEALPLTRNGKINRRLLPLPSDLELETHSEYVAPRNPIEETIVQIWQEILGIEKIGINDNFFELGGHSLTATRLLTRIEKNLDVKIDLRDLFVKPTISGLAEAISTLQWMKDKSEEVNSDENELII